jgi:serine/tyrosine/threonine adenylyltransferase
VSISTRPLVQFENSFARDLAGLAVPWRAAPAPAPQLVVLNEGLADELGVDAETLRSPDGVAMLVGEGDLEGTSPVAQAYAGHQFGSFTPRLGDGRALLLGEVLDTRGRRRDVHLKGSGRTPFARGGDGKAALGPMLRECLIGEGLHALGIPTTRALAVVATGERVLRERSVPGAVLVRIAASHLRVGTFQYAAMSDDPTLLRRLADYAIARHYPEASHADDPYLAFLDGVVDAQASLLARWMLVGFIHGVMNTDNMTISGESIDFGPCAFMDSYDPSTVFSSIDHAGRYAYGNQPQIGLWNLTRLAETVLPLLDAEPEPARAMATEVLRSFSGRYHEHWTNGMRAKLGLGDHDRDAGDLIDELLVLLRAQNVDFTSFFRALSSALLGDTADVRSLFGDPAAFDAWAVGWYAELSHTSPDLRATASAMDRVNPVYIPRNHQVEDALTAATSGDLEPFGRLLDVVAHPFDERPGLESYAGPAPPSSVPYRTFCGT